MSPAIRCFGSVLTGPPVVPVPPGTRCTPRKTRQLTVRPQAYHEAIQAARQRRDARVQSPICAPGWGESRLSQGIRRFALRQVATAAARTHLQQLLTATAMNIVRVIAWLKGEPVGERRRKPGYFARLAPRPLSRQAVLC